MSLDLSIWLTRGPYILEGFWLTLAIVGAVLVISAPLAMGIGLALTSGRRWLTILITVASWLLRGLPPLIILMIAYFVLPLLLDIRMKPLSATIWGFVIYNAFIFGEVVASGLRAVPKGQREAVAALGLPTLRALRRVIVPQAMPVIVPPYISYVTDMVKSTALAGSIGVMELVTRANQAIVATNRPFEILIGVAVIYGLFDLLLIAVQHGCERHWSRGRRRRA